MGSTLYQRQETGWMRKIHVCLCAHLCRSKGQAGGTETDGRTTPGRELPPDGSGAFCVVSGTGRDQAIYTRQICFSDRASYPSGAWFDLRRFFDGETAF